MPDATRRELSSLLSRGSLDEATLQHFCARALVLAKTAQGDPTMRDALAWVTRLGALADSPSPGSRACFSPGDDCLDLIRGEFQRARRTVDVCVFTITDDRICRAMLDAKERGVRLRVISDDDKSRDEGSDVRALRGSGVELRLDATDAHMHHKFAVFDGQRLLTGSYNWTRSAANYNQENLIVSPDPSLVAAFTREFDRLWDEFAPKSPRR